MHGFPYRVDVRTGGGKTLRHCLERVTECVGRNTGDPNPLRAWQDYCVAAVMRAISAVGEEQRRPPSNVAGDRHGTGTGAAPASLAAGVGNRLLRDSLSANEVVGNPVQADSANRARDLRFVR